MEEYPTWPEGAQTADRLSAIPAMTCLSKRTACLALVTKVRLTYCPPVNRWRMHRPKVRQQEQRPPRETSLGMDQGLTGPVFCPYQAQSSLVRRAETFTHACDAPILVREQKPSRMHGDADMLVAFTESVSREPPTLRMPAAFQGPLL